MTVIQFSAHDPREYPVTRPAVLSPEAPHHWLDLLIDAHGVVADISCKAPYGAECRIGCSEGCDLGASDPALHEHPVTDQGYCVHLDCTDFLEDDPLDSYCGETEPLRSGPVDLVWDDHAGLYRWRYAADAAVETTRIEYGPGVTAPLHHVNPYPQAVSEADHHAAATAETGGSHTRVGHVFVSACQWCSTLFIGATEREADSLRLAHERAMSKGTITSLHGVRH